MRIFYLFYFLFKFLHVAINEKIVDDCYYIDHLQDFFFTVNIAGITQNVSCTNNCGCSGTNKRCLSHSELSVMLLSEKDSLQKN